MRIQVAARSGRYEVRGGAGALTELGAVAAAAAPDRPTGVAIVTDTRVERLHLPAAAASLAEAGIHPVVLAVEPGEQAKDFAHVANLCSALAAAGIDRGGLVIALGGGVVCDLAGFTAAVYLRGVPWLAVPTTLLAQVDAAIGGKTAVDLPEGKNLAGAFHAPRAVLVDPAVLDTLPDPEWRSGLGEVAKYAFLIGEPLQVALAGAGPADRLSFARALELCVAHKAALCSLDEFDRGERQKLNLGHTVGHALEAATDYARFRHGEAVALGLIAEADLAERLGLASPGLAASAEDLCARFGLAIRARGIDPARALDRLAADKKRDGHTLRFALPLRPGAVELREVGDRAAIGAALARILENS